MSKACFRCATCRAVAWKERGHINRSRKQGAPLYCSRECAGIGRRKNKTEDQKKEEKRLYDAEYRRKNRAMLKAKKAAYHKRTYDPAAAAVERKKRAAQHAEYCRRPEYKTWKRGYDRQYRAKRDYGEFWEAYLALRDLDQEVDARASRYDVYLENGRLNGAQQRKREHARSHS